jgi:hypothetical protein
LQELVTLASVTLAFWTDSSRGSEFPEARFGLALEQGFYIFVLLQRGRRNLFTEHPRDAGSRPTRPGNSHRLAH